MRTLSKRQKKMLSDWIKSTNPKQFIVADEDLGENLYWKIYKLNPHENFDSNVERFVSDNAEPTDYFGGRW